MEGTDGGPPFEPPGTVFKSTGLRTPLVRFQLGRMLGQITAPADSAPLRYSDLACPYPTEGHRRLIESFFKAVKTELADRLPSYGAAQMPVR